MPVAIFTCSDCPLNSLSMPPAVSSRALRDPHLVRPEFVEIFSRFGSVAHAVILATVDNASRRRGFIVMNSHNEARAAMDGLSRKEIK